ncbi:YtxH domain-containing protein [[Clostridium] innocuum]|nr:YtxH domain-containing protein [[Clostridium] innocuum]MCR0335436.1 YtxH domain-containing protein [[Clostridium] innocuum]MCR0445190.1 YtxH domain-containing protein [[Clostridium] innocuum]
MKTITRKKVLRVFKIMLLICAAILTVAFLTGTVAYATGFVDETVNVVNEYSKYPSSSYSLDFYVDNSWGWLPWNWKDSLGKSVLYGLYLISSGIWYISVMISNAVGSFVQEAFKLDIVNDLADEIGKGMQTLAGINGNGIMSTGFYIGFLLIVIMVVGIYVGYMGLIKRETSSALKAVINFVMIFILSGAFIAYSSDYIKMINEFSSDISTSALELGTKLTMGGKATAGRDSTDLMRDSLFEIQVKKPWLLLQYGNTDIKELGVKRVESLLKAGAMDDGGEQREKIVKNEINKLKNYNMSVPNTVSRLGMTVILFIFNLGISLFVLLLTGMMILSQVLFIMFAIFLPVSFIMAMIPGYEGIVKQSVIRVFNVIMQRAGITLVVVISFFLSSMCYNLSKSYPFFMVMLLQFIVFYGTFSQLSVLMASFGLNSNEGTNMSRRLIMYPRRYMRRGMRRGYRRFRRRHYRSGGSGGSSSASRTGASRPASSGSGGSSSASHTGASRSASDGNEYFNKNTARNTVGGRIGAKVGGVMDTKERIKDKATSIKDGIKSVPTNVAYKGYNTKEQAKNIVPDFKNSVMEERKNRQQQRQSKLENRRQEVARKRSEMGLLQRNETKKDAEIEKPNKESKMHNVKPDISQRDALRRNNIEPAERRKREAAKQTDVRSDTKKVKDAHLLGTANFEARTKKEMDEFSTNKERKDKRKNLHNVHRTIIGDRNTVNGRTYNNVIGDDNVVNGKEIRRKK